MGSYSRFQQFMRSVLRLPPLALSEDESDQYSTYSFRRFLPSVADSLNLSDTEKNCLGNWQDGQKLPLNVRYSAVRLESAASVRRLCLAAIHHLLKNDPEPSWLKLRGVLSHLPRLRDLVDSSSSWGRGVGRLPAPSSASHSPTDRATGSEAKKFPATPHLPIAAFMPRNHRLRRNPHLTP